MARVSVYEDEWYPVYAINQDQDGYGCEIEMTEAELVEFSDVLKRFKEWQKIVGGRYIDARAKSSA